MADAGEIQAMARMAAQAKSFLVELADQALTHRVSPALIRSFHQCLAPIRAFMATHPGLTKLGQQVADLDNRLSTQPVVESARRPEWIVQAAALMASVHHRILLAARRELYPEPAPDPLVRGLCVSTQRDGQAAKLWFPLSCLTRVLKADEIQSQPVRVVGDRAAKSAPMGLWIKSTAGEAVLLVDEVLEVLAWSKAAQLGAQPGLDVFEEFLTQ